MNKLNFGSAGVPTIVKSRNTVEGVGVLKKIGLDCMELEFVHGVRMPESMAKEVNKIREREDIILSAHGPYFINLNSLEKEKKIASVKRILDTARISNLCGASTITFHAAYYMKMGKEEVYKVVKHEMEEIIEVLKNEKNKVWVRPELTGKETQWGDLQELIRLSQDVSQVLPCIDFSHLHARYNGKYNSYDEFRSVLVELERELGKEVIHNMHIHVSGINYSAKGERNHLMLKESDLKYVELLKALKDFGARGIVISESPDPAEDAILLKKTYEEM